MVKTENEISNQYKAIGVARIKTGTYKSDTGAIVNEPTDITELLKEIVKGNS